jgi:hypothetical protein
MRIVRDFLEYIKEGIVKKQSPDKSRADFLKKEAEQNYSFLIELIEKLEVNDRNSNHYIKSCYDIIMELIRAKMLLEGYNSSGNGAHEAEVSYLRLLGFSEVDIQFMDQLRYFRNGILYYGKIFDKEYAIKVINFLNKFYKRMG